MPELPPLPPLGDRIAKICQAVRLWDVWPAHCGLRPEGREHRSACPFCRAPDPAACVAADGTVWVCRRCGRGGDVIHFVELAENVTAADAIASLALRLPQPLLRARGWYREAIERELERIGTCEWRLVAGDGFRGVFKGTEFEADHVEFGAENFGAVLLHAPDLLAELAALPDGGGDAVLLAWWERGRG